MKRLFAWISVIFGVVVLAGFGFGALAVLQPGQGSTAPSDAIVSLGPQSTRLPHAAQLFDEGVADTLVISWYGEVTAGDPLNIAPEAPTPEEYCTDTFTSWVTCFTPQPNNTLGEALSVKSMAAELGWDKVTVVTDQYHANRAGYIFEQCLGDSVGVEVVYPERELGGLNFVYRVLYETTAIVKAFFEVRNHC